MYVAGHVYPQCDETDLSCWYQCRIARSRASTKARSMRQDKAGITALPLSVDQHVVNSPLLRLVEAGSILNMEYERMRFIGLRQTTRPTHEAVSC